MEFASLISGQLVARVYALKERSGLFRHLRELERTQWRSPVQLRNRQIRKLKRILVHAYETADYYRRTFSDSGFNPYDFNELSQLKSLPMLTKTDITRNLDRMISRSYTAKDLITSCTGGSTGTQLHFYLTKESIDKKNACAWRHNRWAGWNLGMPVAALWGNPKEPATFKARIRRTVLDRYIFLDTMNMTSSTMADFAQKIKKLGD